MPKRSISTRKQKHEVSKYLRQLKADVYAFAIEVGATVEPLTFSISAEGAGEVYLPSRDTFEMLNPQSEPRGLVFGDGSFLVFNEVVHFGYRSET